MKTCPGTFSPGNFPVLSASLGLMRRNSILPKTAARARWRGSGEAHQRVPLWQLDLLPVARLPSATSIVPMTGRVQLHRCSPPPTSDWPDTGRPLRNTPFRPRCIRNTGPSVASG